MTIARIHPDLQDIKNTASFDIEKLKCILEQVKTKEQENLSRNYTTVDNVKFAFRECCRNDYIDCARYLLQNYQQPCIEENIHNILSSLSIDCSIELATFLFKENGNIFDVHMNYDSIFKSAYQMHAKNLGKNSKQLCDFLLFDLQMTINENLQEWISKIYPEIQVAIDNYNLYHDMHKSLPTTKKENTIKTKI